MNMKLDQNDLQIGPKYITEGSLLCSAAKAPGHRRAMKVLQIHCICEQRSPFIPGECASYGNMEKHTKLPPPPCLWPSAQYINKE